MGAERVQVLMLLDWCEQLPSLNSPVDEHLGLLPTSIHALTLDEDHDEVVAIFLETAGKAGPRGLRNPRLDASEAIDPKQPVRVHPVVRGLVLLVDRFELDLLDAGRLLRLALLVVRATVARGGDGSRELDDGPVLPCLLGRRLSDRSLDGTNGAALVRLRPHNLAEQWLLHAGGGQTRHIVGCGHVLLVHEPVRAVKVAV